jgi:hypothetical protein
MNVTTGRGRTNPLVSGGVYGVLFVFGAVQGMLGSFLYSGMTGPLPLAAIGFCVAILATCLLAAWALRTVSGALVPAIGWIAASFVLSMPVASGSVIITNTAAGKWYLYGGTLSAVAGVVLASLTRARPR